MLHPPLSLEMCPSVACHTSHFHFACVRPSTACYILDTPTTFTLHACALLSPATSLIHQPLSLCMHVPFSRLLHPCYTNHFHFACMCPSLACYILATPITFTLHACALLSPATPTTFTVHANALRSPAIPPFSFCKNPSHAWYIYIYPQL